MKTRKIKLKFSNVLRIWLILFSATSPLVLFSQTSNEIFSKLGKDLENDMAKHFSTSMPKTIYSPEGDSVIDTKTLLLYDGKNQILNEVLSKKKEMIPILIQNLNTNENDWISNVLLHSIFEKRADSFLIYQILGYELWRENQKALDVQYWKSINCNSLDKK